MRPPPGLRRDSRHHAALQAAFAAMPADYQPRTHLKQNGRPLYINRLVFEPSPYLLQHAHNPVDWWAWGEAALAEAARRDLPIFLSAGYATCHWCHVMEEESFDNVEVAEFLNARFIAVKLDREQRPDIDHIYLTATTLQHRHAGWPNSCWLTPQGKPFHTGTYFPRPQFLATLHAIEKAWVEGRNKLERFAEELAQQVQSVSRRTADAADAADLNNAPALAVQYLTEAHNRQHGGFSSGTQFPNEGHILFLLDHWRRTGETPALETALHTLDAIAAGGIHDHVGGGFHRYTVDVNWRTPHFEKMLYNQALLMRCFTQAWEITANPTYKRAIERGVAYLARDMTEPDGSFASAEDADSLNPAGQREEGAFYAWSLGEFTDCLGDDAARFGTILGLDKPATLEAGAVIHLTIGQPVDPTLDPVLEKLRQTRDNRPRPFRDAKIIGGWNGLMIRGLAEAGLALDRQDWIDAADKALKSLLGRLETPSGLARLHAGGQVLEQANLSDHAWIALAALGLADAGKSGWSDELPKMAQTILDTFTNDHRLALTQNSPLGPVLEAEDGATPSGESSALEFFALLNYRQPDLVRQARAEDLRDAISGPIAAMPVIRLTGLLACQILKSESTNLRVFADGALTIRLRRSELILRIARGWHLTAANTLGLSALAITGAALPEPARNGSYTGTITIPLANSAAITVSAQVCSDSFCLAPFTTIFRRRR